MAKKKAKKRGPRPRPDAKKKKLQIRVTEDEAADIATAAGSDGVSSWGRVVLVQAAKRRTAPPTKTRT